MTEDQFNENKLLKLPVLKACWLEKSVVHEKLRQKQEVGSHNCISLILGSFFYLQLCNRMKNKWQGTLLPPGDSISIYKVWVIVEGFRNVLRSSKLDFKLSNGKRSSAPQPVPTRMLLLSHLLDFCVSFPLKERFKWMEIASFHSVDPCILRSTWNSGRQGALHLP